jgi:hypothetical protein
MNKTWRPVETQIIQKYAGMTPEQINENFFHHNLVTEFLVVEKILSDLHSTEEKLFTTSANVRSLAAEIADLRAQFETRKTAWKAAIDRALARPSDPQTGLPVAVTIEGIDSKTAAPASHGGGNGNG